MGQIMLNEFGVKVPALDYSEGVGLTVIGIS